jgi:hypothetical protein
MNSTSRRRRCACFLAVFVGFIAIPLTAPAAGLRVVNRSYPGIYFGSFAGAAGTFALYVREDNTGTFLGYVTSSGIGISHSMMRASFL